MLRARPAPSWQPDPEPRRAPRRRPRGPQTQAGAPESIARDDCIHLPFPAALARVLLLQLPPYFPQIGKEVPAEGGAKVRGAHRAAGAGPRADGALHHLHVTVAPLLKALVEIDQPLAQLRVLRVRSVDADQHLLDLR